MDRIEKNPKDSNIYRKSNVYIITTPTGSHYVCNFIFYKYQIPSGLKKI